MPSFSLPAWVRLESQPNLLGLGTAQCMGLVGKPSQPKVQAVGPWDVWLLSLPQPRLLGANSLVK